MFEPQWTLTPLIQRQLVAIDRTVGYLYHARLEPDWINKTRIRDALSSVQIEGNKLTFEDALELAHTRADLTTADDDAREFLNYLETFHEIRDMRDLRAEPPVIGDILNLHRSVVRGVRGGDRFAGQLRREEVSVGDVQDGKTIIHHKPPHWSRVEDELRNLVAWINRSYEKKAREELELGASDSWVHPVIVAGIAQHRLVWIHPFVDGNGRTARMFTTMLLYGREYDFKNLFDLSSYYNGDRDAYYAALRRADRENDYTRWLEYFTGGFAHQMYLLRHPKGTSIDASP